MTCKERSGRRREFKIKVKGEEKVRKEKMFYLVFCSRAAWRLIVLDGSIENNAGPLQELEW